MYNYGFERFHTMLERHPKTLFIGHAQTWWANIDKNHTNQAVLYPKGKVAPGGLTDRSWSSVPAGPAFPQTSRRVNPAKKDRFLCATR